ncbi:MAG: serine/threonine-protein kinase [Acidobacteria bacterium]|nr:serine/threonine-protein kinase [Acidobacteriota bacterium]
MTDQNWQRTWEVFEAAAELPADERAAFVQAELKDAELAERVFEMLRRLSGSGESAVATLAEPGPDEPEWSWLGQTVGRFRITGTLGRGGMGEVYEAVDTELERKVAIKFLASGRFGSTGGVERFQREARAASALNHPGVVTIHEILRVGQDMAIVMELVGGEPLRQLCGSAVAVAEVKRLGAQIAQALGVAHDAGIVHRDIKPENLMLRPDGLVKILDFGLARQVGNESQNSAAGLPLGTLRYMSPEQIRGEKATAASDVFSLGLVLYELSTGRHAFGAESALATTHRIAGDEPVAPSVLMPGFDAGLELLLLRMLDKDPVRRPGAAEVAAGLRADEGAAPRRGALRWSLVGVSAACLLLASWVLLRPGPAVQETKGATVAKLSSFTSLPGDEIDPDFSPSGDRIVYAWNGGNEKEGHDIYVRRVGVHEPVRLSADPEDEFSPVWSPDGKKIAFLRGSVAGVRVIVADADGRNERIITAGSGQSAVKKRLAWMPDSKAVILGDDAPGRGDALTLYRVSIDTGERTRFSSEPGGDEDLSPLLSHDGHYLAFIRAEGVNRNVWIARPDGTGLRRLVESQANIHSIAWAPDSGGVYFVKADKPRLIQQRRLDGSEGQGIQVEGMIRHVTSSRTGRQVAYMRAVSESNIYRLAAGGREFVKVLSTTANEEDPRYSPDGKQIAYTSDRDGNGAVFVMRADGSGSRQMTSFHSYSASASWSPDGQWIACDSAPAGHTEVFLVRASDGVLRTLSRGYMPLFSATRPWVYFTRKTNGRNELWRAGVDGGEAVQLTANGGLEGRESPDGKWLYYSKPAQAGIFRRAVEGGAEQLLAGLKPFERYWDVGAQGIYYIGENRLWLYDVATEQSRELAQLSRPAVRGPRGLSVGPDGAVLLVQFDAFRREIVLGEL